jgi:hypothetical protein
MSQAFLFDRVMFVFVFAISLSMLLSIIDGDMSFTDVVFWP